jgi:hypothetical protein
MTLGHRAAPGAGSGPPRVECRRRARAVGNVVVPVLAVLLLSCDQSTLPTAPSDVTSGLTVYEHANYLGESALLTRSIADLSDYEGPCLHSDTGPAGSTVTLDWNDCISSVRIAQGWEATIYRDSDYSGDSLNVTGDLPNLQLVQGGCSHDGMNDCITSIKVVRPELALVPESIGQSSRFKLDAGPTLQAAWLTFRTRTDAAVRPVPPLRAIR